MQERHTDVVLDWCEQADENDITDALLCDTTAEVIAYATHALEKHILRGMDAIHLGAAQVCKADVFVSCDHRQCLAAQALGLNVIGVG